MKKKNKDLVVKKERLISISISFKFIVKLILISLALIGIWCLFYFNHIYVYLHETSKYKYYLFMILVSIMTLLSLLSIGLYFGNLGHYYKIFILIICVYLFYLGYTYVGIGIEFRTHFGLLNYNIFENNSKKGIDFYVRNIYLIIIVYFISLPFESEK